ncbi:MAG: STAS domain-containing protein [Clostridiales Family XIII bacterium]|jgi:anti-sigma B factor antagonist|nr:STAS domain-containing protein [Clostridiales Family XIII bacterium]
MTYAIKKDYDSQRDKWLVVLTGEIDISNAAGLKQELSDAYGEHAADMDVDISGISYIDSTGLGIIISLYGKMRESGNKIKLLNPRDNVKKLLKITQLDKVLC